MKSALFALGMIAAATATRSARAASWPDEEDQARPCRPTVSCTADIVAPGVFEAELGAAASSGAQGHVASAPILLKQTVATFLQLQVGSNGYTVVTDSSSASQLRYFDNLFFGPKFHVRDQGDVWPSLSVSAEISVPAFCADAPLVPRDGGVRVAVSAAARPWLVVDVAGDRGFFPSTHAYTFVCGVTMIPAVFWRPEKAPAR